MNRNEMSVLWQGVVNSSGKLQREISDCFIHSLKKMDELEENAEGPVFNHRHGRVVLWDGDIWFLNADEDTIYALGHTRGSRSIEEGDPEDGFITIGSLVDVTGLLNNLEAQG